MGAKVAMAALQVLVEEKLAENSERLGKVLRSQLQAIASPRVKLVGYSCLVNNSTYKSRTALQSLGRIRLGTHTMLKAIQACEYQGPIWEYM